MKEIPEEELSLHLPLRIATALVSDLFLLNVRALFNACVASYGLFPKLFYSTSLKTSQAEEQMEGGILLRLGKR